MTWQGDEPGSTRIDMMGRLRIAWRAPLLLAINFGCLALLCLVRVIERPLCGVRRPVTPWITQFVCISSLWVMGIRLRRHGRAMPERGALVANHGSWLDIYVLNACARIYFVSKAEVARWPGIGWLARATGTVFINRRGTEARAQQDLFEQRLRAGHHLLFFPEGTSTDGQRVLPFKTTLFAAFLAQDLKDILSVQPVTVVYHAPKGEDVRFHGWWGGMPFGPHMRRMLAAQRGGSVDVTFHEPIPVAEAGDRKRLAAMAEAAVRGGHPSGQVSA